MNCPFCHSPFSYSAVGTTFYRVKCSKADCSNVEFQERLILGFADNYPSKELTDYSMLIPVEGIHYTFTSILDTGNPYSSIEYSPAFNQDPVMLYEWKEWIPFREDLDFYITKIRRLANLKAFW